MTTPKDQWKEVDKRLAKINLCNCDEICFGHTQTRKELKMLFHSELEKVRQETIEQCVNALPRKPSYSYVNKVWRSGVDRALDDAKQNIQALSINNKEQ